MTVAVRTLADDVWALLQAIPSDDGPPPTGLFTWRGEIVDDEGQPVEPPADPDGRVHPYAVAYFFPGRRTSNRVCGNPNQLDWSLQISCVGGDDVRALWAVDQVRAALEGQMLTGSKLREVIGGSAAPQPNDNIQPPRYVSYLHYGLIACG